MTSSHTGGFGAHGPGQGFPYGPQALWDMLDQMRSTFEKKMMPRVSRGDVRATVLSLLAEQPMHGYQIIGEIDKRSGGTWKPSAGSVYPTLQLLADEGMITAEESNGRKTYSLTEAGRAEAEETADRATPWEGAGMTAHGPLGALPKAGVELAQAAAQVARTGSPEQVKQAVTVLVEARRRLHGILAED